MLASTDSSSSSQTDYAARLRDVCKRTISAPSGGPSSSSTSSPSLPSWEEVQAVIDQSSTQQQPSLVARLPFLPDADGRSAFHWAVASGNTEVVRRFLEFADSSSSSSSSSPSTTSGIPLKKLTPKAIVNTKDDAGYTPLMSAAAAGYVEIIRTLLAAGADMTITNEGNANALHLHKGRAKVIDAFTSFAAASSGAGKQLQIALKQQDSASGATPLHRAAGPGFTDAARALLHAGSDVNAVDYEGNTSLHRASEEGRRDMIALLLEHGASIQIMNKEKKKASDLVPPVVPKFTTTSSTNAILEAAARAGIHLRGQPKSSDTNDDDEKEKESNVSSSAGGAGGAEGAGAGSTK